MIVGSVKAEKCKTFPDPAPNDTDVEHSIKQMKSNDPALTELNLNNIQVGLGMGNSIDSEIEIYTLFVLY